MFSTGKVIGMAINGDDTIVLGMDGINSYHRSFIEQFEKLSAAVQRGNSNEIIEELAKSLFEYAQIHFNSEEKPVLDYSYPKIKVPCDEHECDTQEVAIETAGKLLKWMFQQINTRDREVTSYVHECICHDSRRADIPCNWSVL
jgi:hemerythrin